MIRRWLPHAVLALIALALLWQLQRGDGGRGELADLQARIATQAAENARLEQRNQALAADVAELKSGEAAVEDRARGELGMIKPGETFYRVVEGAGSARQVSPRTSSAEPTLEAAVESADPALTDGPGE